MKRITAVLALCLHLVSSLRPSAFAEVPTIINYQGRLLDGTNLANGPGEPSLRLYSASAGGTILYEDSNTVTVADGLYTAALGDHPTKSASCGADQLGRVGRGRGERFDALATLDADGVVLAAIQALAAEDGRQRTEYSGQQERLDVLEVENARLRQELKTIKQHLGL
jgi:hypothetical protein